MTEYAIWGFVLLVVAIIYETLKNFNFYTLMFWGGLAVMLFANVWAGLAIIAFGLLVGIMLRIHE